MTSSIKRHHSLLWKSLMAILDNMENGIRWMVGDGSKIKMLGDMWLPSQATIKVQSIVKILPQTTTIKELLIEGGTTWNEELINSIFWVNETKAILSIPLSKNWVEDKLIWALIENGKSL